MLNIALQMIEYLTIAKIMLSYYYRTIYLLFSLQFLSSYLIVTRYIFQSIGTYEIF